MSAQWITTNRENKDAKFKWSIARPSIAPHLAVEVGEPRECVEGEGDLGGPRQDAPVPRLDQLVQAAAVDELRSGDEQPSHQNPLKIRKWLTIIR